MPKESITLNGFGGGLNKEADLADLVGSGREGQDEVAEANKFFLDYRGKIVSDYPALDSGLPTGITAASGDNVDNTADKLLIYDSKYYQNTGIYKLGKDINWTDNFDYMGETPTQGSLIIDGYTAGTSKYRGVDLRATYKREDDIIVFLGKSSKFNPEGEGIIFDKNM